MASGRSARKLRADCVSPINQLSPTGYFGGESFVCEPFKVASVHICHSTWVHYPVYYNFVGCDVAPGNPSVLQGSYHSMQYLRGPTGYLYGRTPKTTVKEIPDVYFLPEELALWRKRRMFPLQIPQPQSPEQYPPQDYPPIFAGGPGCTNNQVCYAIRRRVHGEPEYENYLGWNFTDPTDSTNSLINAPICCCHEDWLGYTYPAKWIWHNKGIEQPFNAVDYWEQSKTKPERIANPQMMNFLPFCTPLNVRNKQGSIIGQYIGYTHMIFFNNNAYMCGNDMRDLFSFNEEGDLITIKDIGLPRDPTYDGENIPPPVNRIWDAMSLDVHFYIVSSNEEIHSPRIGSIRFWRPNVALGNSLSSFGESCCKPYFYWACGPMNSDWGIPVKYNYVNPVDGVNSEIIIHGFSNTRAYMVA